MERKKRERKTLTFPERLAIIDWLRSDEIDTSHLRSSEPGNEGWYLRPLADHLRAMAGLEAFGAHSPDPERLTDSVVRGILRDMAAPVARQRKRAAAATKRSQNGARLEVVARELKRLFELLGVEVSAELVAVIDRKAVTHGSKEESDAD